MMIGVSGWLSIGKRHGKISQLQFSEGNEQQHDLNLQHKIRANATDLIQSLTEEGKQLLIDTTTWPACIDERYSMHGPRSYTSHLTIKRYWAEITVVEPMNQRRQKYRPCQMKKGPAHLFPELPGFAFIAFYHENSGHNTELIVL